MYLLQRVCFAASCLIAWSPSIAIGSNYVLMYKYAPQVMCALLLPLPPSWSIFLCTNGGDHQEEPVFILCVKTALPMVRLANIFPNRSSCYGARGASWWCLHFTCIYRPQRKVIDIGQFNSVAPRHCTHTHTCAVQKTKRPWHWSRNAGWGTRGERERSDWILFYIYSNWVWCSLCRKHMCECAFGNCGAHI